MKKLFTVMVMTASGAVHSGVVIDSFDDPLLGQGATIAKPNGAVASVWSSEPSTGAIGGYRSIYVGTTSGTKRSQISALVNVTPDYFLLTSDSVSIAGYAGVVWDGGKPAGLNYDFSSCKTLRWDYDNDQTTVYSLTFETYGGFAHTVSVSRPAGAAGVQLIPLIWYSDAGVDLSDVDRISIRIDAGPGGDAAIHYIGCDIPEPAAAGAVLGVLAAVGMAIRRMRSA